MSDLTWNDPGEGDEVKQTRYKDPDRIRKLTMARETVYQMWEGGIRDLHEIELETSYSIAYIRRLLRDRGFDVGVVRVKSTEEVKAICADYVGGMKVKDVLKKWDITNNTLYEYLDEQGIQNRRADPDFKKGRREFLDLAVEMYQQNFPIKDIVIETGITASTLYQELANREIPLRARYEPDKEVSNLAIQLYQEKRPIADIMNETGVTSNALYAKLRELKIPVQRGRDLAKRTEVAVTMYQQGARVEAIYVETGINTTQLYKALRTRGVQRRNRTGAGTGHDLDRAFQMYDQGAEAKDIVKATGVSVVELVSELKKRGTQLRSGLSTRVTARSMEFAVKGYETGIDIDTIEIDTLISRPQLFAELKKRGISLRP